LPAAPLKALATGDNVVGEAEIRELDGRFETAGAGRLVVEAGEDELLGEGNENMEELLARGVTDGRMTLLVVRDPPEPEPVE
jgi:hypothetical protein